MLSRPIFQLSVFSCLIHANISVYTKEVSELDTLVFSAQDVTKLLDNKQELQQLAGPINFIEVENRQQRLQTNADILQVEPGIYAQTAGNEGVKISIRGSGINRGSGAHASGTYVLLDNIPFTGPGGTPYELLEPSWLSHVEVLRGSHGFERGALALGGAINYVSQNGKNQPGGRLDVAVGSHAYQKYNLSYGQDLGTLDYFIAATHTQSHGYQQHSQSEGTGITANWGYQVNDQVDTRLYMRYREIQHQTPGRLTQTQIKDNPTQANPYNLSINAQRIQPGSTWLANQTTWQLAQGGKLQASLAYHDYPMDLQESLYRVSVDYTDLTGNLNWTQPFTWLARDNIAKVIFRTTRQHDSALGTERLRFDNAYGEAGEISRRYVHRGNDQVLNLQNELKWWPNLWLITGGGLIYTERDAYVTQPQTKQKLQQQTWDYVYRLGLRYTYHDQTQFYVNASRSVEPAHAWSMLWGSDQYFGSDYAAATGRQSAAIPLKNQTATGIEVGGHGENRLGQWAINYYYTQLKNELLMRELQPSPNQIVAESNANSSIHQGLELGLNSQLLQTERGAEWRLKQAYTFSNFHYQHDRNFNQNELAGIPRHYYQAKLNYQHPQGWFIGLNTEYASKIPIDYANSHYSKAYQIWGMQAGWNSILPDVDLWWEMKNLGDKKYSSTITPGFNDFGVDRARATPGESRAIYAGLNYQF